MVVGITFWDIVVVTLPLVVVKLIMALILAGGALLTGYAVAALVKYVGRDV